MIRAVLQQLDEPALSAKVATESDPMLIGKWESVDYVEEIGHFNPDKRNWTGELFLKEINYMGGGKISILKNWG